MYYHIFTYMCRLFIHVRKIESLIKFFFFEISTHGSEHILLQNYPPALRFNLAKAVQYLTLNIDVTETINAICATRPVSISCLTHPANHRCTCTFTCIDTSI